ncbi:MAG: hypothetical protein M0P42_14130 [Gallionella sp.]|nr:hypothetical protein [Gallionella sp.]
MSSPRELTGDASAWTCPVLGGFGPNLTGRLGNDFLSIEQQVNLYHLMSQVIAYRVPGEALEVGPATGTSAVMLQGILDVEAVYERHLHVIDIRQRLDGVLPSEDDLTRPFRAAAVSMPVMNLLPFESAIPACLPPIIAFANLNFCQGRDDQEQTHLMGVLLDHLYSRLAAGAVVSVLDYWHHHWHQGTANLACGVSPAVEVFIADKPEQLTVLSGGNRTHAYFRKGVSAGY